MRSRWNDRKDLVVTVRWLGHLALPYGLFYLVQPLGRLPRDILHEIAQASRTPDIRGLVLSSTGVALWLLGTALACLVVRRRGLRFY